MKATFYNNASDERYLNKSITAKYSNIDVEVITPASIVRPSFRLSSGLLGQSVNYVYVKELERYYYIRNWTMDNGFVILECEVDVLMSFKKAIKEQNVIVSRQEHKYNLYQNDDRFKLYNYQAVKTIAFDSSDGFDFNTTNYVLAVVGDADGGGE